MKRNRWCIIFFSLGHPYNTPMSLQSTPNLISGLGPFRTSSIYSDIDQLPNYDFNASRSGLTASSLAQLQSELHPTASLANVPNLISGMGPGPFSPAYLYQDVGQLGNYALTATRSGLHSNAQVLPGYTLTSKKQGPGAPENAGLVERLNLQTTPDLISGLNGQRFKDAILYQDIQQAGNFLQGRSGMDPYKGSAYDVSLSGMHSNSSLHSRNPSTPYGPGSGYDYVGNQPRKYRGGGNVSGFSSRNPSTPYGPGSGYDYVSDRRSGFNMNPYGPGSGYDYVSSPTRSGMRAAAEIVGQFDVSGQFQLPVNARALRNSRSRIEGLKAGIRRATQLPSIMNVLSLDLPNGGLKKKGY